MPVESNDLNEAYEKCEFLGVFIFVCVVCVFSPIIFNKIP